MDKVEDINSIMQRLPHRYPFLLIDRILEVVPGETLAALKNVSYNEPFFQGHFPELPIMPGVLILEAMGQAGGVLVYNSLSPENKDSLFFFTGMDKVRFRKPVVPGDQLILKDGEVIVDSVVWEGGDPVGQPLAPGAAGRDVLHVQEHPPVGPPLLELVLDLADGRFREVPGGAAVQAHPAAVIQQQVPGRARQLQRLARDRNDRQLEETARSLQDAARAMREAAARSCAASASPVRRACATVRTTAGTSTASISDAIAPPCTTPPGCNNSGLNGSLMRQ